MPESGRPRVGSLLREAARVAASQPVPSLVSALLVAVACGVILATVGQTAAAETDVLARIDQAGTRSVVLVDTDGRAELKPSALDRIAALSTVEWIVGIGPATDVVNSRIEGGSPAALRTVYGRLPGSPYLVTSTWENRPGTALVGPGAQATLGLAQPVGGATGNQGDIAVVGWFQAKDPLASLNQGLITPPDPDQAAQILRSIHILAQRPQDVAALTDAARALAAPEDPTSLGIETSETLAQVRAAVAGELGRFGRQLVLMVLAAAVVLIGLTVYGSVTTRRRDFGRRRALGASRTALVALVVAQTGFVAAVGATMGTTVGTIIAHRLSGASLQPDFIVAVATLCILAAAIASLPPAIIAAHRDPVRILRVP